MVVRILGATVGVAIILFILFLRGLPVVFFLKMIPLIFLLIIAVALLYAAVTID